MKVPRLATPSTTATTFSTGRGMVQFMSRSLSARPAKVETGFASITVNARLTVPAANKADQLVRDVERMARVARKTGLELALHIARLAWSHPATARLRGGVVAAFGVALAAALITYNPDDRSLNVASAGEPGAG